MSGAEAQRSDPAASRTRSAAFGLLALGGVGGLLAAGRPWWTGVAAAASLGFSGTESTAGLAQALPLVVLAGTLLALTLRARGRRMVGVVLALVALGSAVVGYVAPAPPDDLTRTRLQALTLSDQMSLRRTAWPVVSAIAALLALLGALALVRFAPRWPTRAARFEREPAVANASTGDAVDPARLWSALDAGLDPTDPSDATDPSNLPAKPAPIRPESGAGVRMGNSASGSGRSGLSRRNSSGAAGTANPSSDGEAGPESGLGQPGPGKQ